MTNPTPLISLSSALIRVSTHNPHRRRSFVHKEISNTVTRSQPVPPHSQCHQEECIQNSITGNPPSDSHVEETAYSSLDHLRTATCIHETKSKAMLALSSLGSTEPRFQKTRSSLGLKPCCELEL